MSPNKKYSTLWENVQLNEVAVNHSDNFFEWLKLFIFTSNSGYYIFENVSSIDSWKMSCSLLSQKFANGPN